MHSAAAAVAWEFRQKHRWGLLVMLTYAAVLAASRLFAFDLGVRAASADVWTFALMVVVPLAATFMYFLAVFSYGLEGDLAAQRSMYPPRLFTLPVTTAALVGWPMLYGVVAMIVLWATLRTLAIWPSDFAIPLVWPALLAASLMAWTQALTWMPYPLRGLRVLVIAIWLAIIDAIVMIALEMKAPEPVMLALLLPHVPLAYLAARFAVGRARRGEVPDWSAGFTRIRRIVDVLPRRRAHFPSAARAQEWFEWRQHGRSLPFLIALLLPFELAMLFPFRDTPVVIAEVLLLILLSPPFMAIYVAATVSKPNPNASDSYGLPPFIATRPLSDAALIAAKLKAAVWSTLATWLLVLTATPAALKLSGAWPTVLEWGGDLSEVIGRRRAIAVVVLTVGFLIVATWKQLVQSLYIGMTGREAFIKGSGLAALVFIGVVVPLANWVLDHRVAIQVLWNYGVFILTALALLKLSTAVWIAIRLHDRSLLAEQTLIGGAACWCAAVFALYALLTYIAPEILFRRYFLMLVAILVVPLARLSAAPLAVAANRHR